MQVLNGRYGPYIAFEKKNYKIPKTQEPSELTLEMCKEIIEKAPKTAARGAKKTTAKKTTTAAKKAPAKKAPAKKAAAKKTTTTKKKRE